jgi:acyl-coenzyme A thioesterase PaaI-like protein
MAETPPSESVHPLIEKALRSKVPVADLIGFRVEEIGGGRAVGLLQSGPQHANPMGTLHGGVLCDLSDAAMGMAFVTTLAPDEMDGSREFPTILATVLQPQREEKEPQRSATTNTSSHRP